MKQKNLAFGKLRTNATKDSDKQTKGIFQKAKDLEAKWVGDDEKKKKALKEFESLRYVYSMGWKRDPDAPKFDAECPRCKCKDVIFRKV